LRRKSFNPPQRETVMKTSDQMRIVLLPILALVLAAGLIGSMPNPASAGMIQKAGLALKKDLGPQITLDQTLFNVKIPLTITNMPGPWANAKLKAVAIVYFLDAAGDAIGYALSENGEEWTPLAAGLVNGGYNGTVLIPIRKTAGTISGKTCCVAMVVAELGDQHMFLGGSTGGTAPSSGQCDDLSWDGIAPGTIVPY
jgi:hypothetical protein